MLRQDLRQSVAIHRIELPTPLPMGTVNAFVLITESQRVLVDCGLRYEAARATLWRGLADIGLKPEDLTALVLTHGHVDHVGLAGEFHRREIPIYAHPDVQTWLEPEGPWETYRKAFYQRLYQEMGMPQEDQQRALAEYSFLRRWTDRSVVDVPLADGRVFPPLPMFRVLYVPGHAQAAIALWNEQTGELLIGDQLLPHISSNALIEPRLDAADGAQAERTPSLIQYRANLKSLLALPIRRVYPGHGDPFTDAHGLIHRRLQDQERRRDQFLDLLRETGPRSAYSLAIQYFPRHREQPSLILSETLGYLDWLASEGLVESRIASNGIIEWFAV